MNDGRTLFSQLMDFLPAHEFRKCVDRYGGNRRIRSFSCHDQFLCMAFAQLTYRESLRDIEICLRSLGSRLYHAGIRGGISRSTLANANESRDWRIYADFAAVLIARARHLYRHEDLGLDLEQTVYAFDSTTIDLCLTLFPWARFRRNIPCFVHISDGKMNDVRALDLLVIEPGAFYVLDRGYIDFARLYAFTQGLAFFVTRAKSTLDFRRTERRVVDKSTGLRSDNTIVLCGPKSSTLYPQPLRRIRYYAEEQDRRLVFLTNNFALPALTIAHLYRRRWQVELFFKWIKQYLRIKAFFGTSPNAVKTQVWIAISVYVLAAIARKEMGVSRSLGEMLQILSIGLFEKTPLLQAFSNGIPNIQTETIHNQLSLFDF
jgi:hypothetical protein